MLRGRYATNKTTKQTALPVVYNLTLRHLHYRVSDIVSDVVSDVVVNRFTHGTCGGRGGGQCDAQVLCVWRHGQSGRHNGVLWNTSVLSSFGVLWSFGP